MHGCMYVCMYVCMDGWMDVWMDGCTYVRTYTCIYLCIIRTYLCLHHFPMVILATGGQHGIYPASSASSSGVLWLASSLVRSTLDRISARRLSMGRDVLLGDGVGIESRNIPWNIDESIVILSPISSFNLSNTRFNEDHDHHWVPRARVQNFIHHLQIRVKTPKKCSLEAITWISHHFYPKKG